MTVTLLAQGNVESMVKRREADSESLTHLLSALSSDPGGHGWTQLSLS